MRYYNLFDKEHTAWENTRHARLHSTKYNTYGLILVMIVTIYFCWLCRFHQSFSKQQTFYL